MRLQSSGMLTKCYRCVTHIQGRAGRAWLLFCVAALFSAGFATAKAQQPASTSNTVKKSDPTTGYKIKRWFEFDALSISTRYRLIQNAGGITTNDQVQYQFAGRGHFKFDKDGKYSVYAGLFTGNTFTAGWNSTGWGTGNLQTNLYLKQLYFDAKPVKGLEFQFGGIPFNNGENTEITTYDNDAYLTGERIAVRMPKKYYFDEISAANGYIGDLTQPGIFHRFKHLGKSNYHQFLVRKQVNKHVSFSADYTFESGRDTLHQAVKFKVPESHILDTVLFENYQRVDPTTGYGMNLYGEKVLKKKVTLGGGFARIDRPMNNADRFSPGKRLYINGSVKLTRELTLSSILIEGVGKMPSSASVRRRFEIIFSYNILETLHKLKLN